MRPRFALPTLKAWGKTPEGFAVLSLVIVLVFVLVVAFTLPHSNFRNTIEGANPTGAKEALGLLKDTTQWLAGIQTATLAALGFIAKEGITSLGPTTLQLRLSILVAVLNSAALFFSAWVLTALPSVTLRIFGDPVCNYDFFNLRIYPSLERFDPYHVLTVQFFAFCNHWLWALGVLLFGWLCVSIAISRSNPQPRRKINGAGRGRTPGRRHAPPAPY